MRVAFLDCATGISGDMTVAALIDLGVEIDTLREIIDSFRIPGVKLHVTEVMRGGFRAKHFRVEHPEQHAHRHLSDIIQLLDRSDKLSERSRTLALNMFEAIAAAEAKVHGMSIDKVHFHEVGAIDSIVDIVCAAVGFDIIDVDEVVCSSVPTGRGTVHIAHGECAVPTPGTAELLRDVPLVDVPINTELTTPTGAAIIKATVDRFTAGWPAMSVERIGYGAGTKDFRERANILRIILGETETTSESDIVALLETNLDDATPEVIGYTKRRLMSAGALDVYTSSIQMKKDRPGIMLSVICDLDDIPTMETILFEETPTLGIRKQTIQRSVRQRTKVNVDTEWGPVKGKVGWREGEAAVFSPEYDDCARIAEAYEVPFREVYLTAQAEFLLQTDADEDFAHDHDGEPCDGDHDDDDDEDHPHDHGHHHDHSHDHSHDHDHRHDHDHGGDHSHDHDHRHDHDH